MWDTLEKARLLNLSSNFLSRGWGNSRCLNAAIGSSYYVGRRSLKQMTDLETKGSGNALGDHYVKTVLQNFCCC